MGAEPSAGPRENAAQGKYGLYYETHQGKIPQAITLTGRTD